MRTKDAVGQYGEQLAAEHLSQQGFAILARNWRCDQGEIDIVARDGRALVVCEVKTRRGAGYGSPLESITYRKLSTLRRLVGRWLQEHELHPPEIRIDAIAVLVPPGGGKPTIEHLRGVG